jgi:drug/metabolite transporter (DMT)-like permease
MDRMIPRIPPLAYALMVALALLWGLSWPLMKLALTEMEPLRFRVFAVAIGGAGLLLVARASGYSLRVTPGQLWRTALVAFFSAVLWSVFMSYGLRLMASGRAVIIAYTFPVWSVPLSAWLLGEPLTRRRTGGLALGMAGLALLLGDEIHAVGRSPLGALLMFATATCWAAGTILAKKFALPIPVSVFAGWQNVLAAVPLLALSLLLESGPFAPFGLSTGPMLGALYAAFVASLFCHWAWYKLVSITPATVASLSILSVPIVGVFFGLLVLGERARATDYIALALVVASLCTVMLPGRRAAVEITPAGGSTNG